MLDPTERLPITERIEFSSDRTIEEFLEYCVTYKHLGVPMDRNPYGSLVMEPPVGYDSGQFGSKVGFALRL